MNYFFYDDPIEHIVIDNFYTQEEVEIIKNEMGYLSGFVKPANQIDPTIDQVTVLPLANNFALDLDISVSREESKILQLNRKVLTEEFKDQILSLNPILKHIKYINQDFTHLNYYGNQSYYRGHWNKSLFTIITTFISGEIQGGGIHFDEFDYTIPFQENRVVIIPGGVVHSIPEVSAINNSLAVTMTQFLSIG